MENQGVKDFISKTLVESFNKESTKNDKLQVLNALLIGFCEECKIKKENVKYIEKSLTNSQSLLEVKEFDGEDFYFINIDEAYILKSSMASFVATIVHEWGHIYYYEKEKRGEIKLEGVDIDETKEILLPFWQKLGIGYKYAACEDEFEATMFAINHIYTWLENAKALNLDENKINNLANKIKRVEKQTKRARKIALVKYKIWQKISRTLNIEEQNAMFSDLPDGMSEEEYIYNNNLKVFEEFGKATKEELENAIIKIEQKAERREKFHATSIKANQKRVNEKLFLTDCYVNLLAINCGLNQEEIGIKLCENNEILEFVSSRKENKRCPLFGYINLSVGNMSELSTIEYARILNSFVRNLERDIIRTEFEDCGQK